ncbi:type II toxin-antitoxin system HicB family antitoxin [Phreatobacter stygius]|uniref:HicB family protein n=1 Tax=Phreatobacter stygius TaxID=1940610 RepID=A0A4D7AYW0_9HYPH|nr:type II toxin-antitoxin system HicB family antitoxin [Phreatobacter stygius]QCI65491.1 HicB family protein [Phreatobacter stygius]
MIHYLAIVEDEGPEFAVGVWFPDLPGCTSAGDTVEEAMLNAREVVALYLEDFPADGKPNPSPRSLAEIKADPEHADDVVKYIVALIPFDPVPHRVAAE